MDFTECNNGGSHERAETFRSPCHPIINDPIESLSSELEEREDPIILAHTFILCVKGGEGVSGMFPGIASKYD